MSMDFREQLSALMDGELERDERAFLLRRLQHDGELKATWTRYHLMRDVMARRPGSTPLDLSDRVMRALDAPTVQPVAADRQRWWRPMAGVALAASVAWMAVVAVSPRSALMPAGELLAESAPAVRAARPLDVPGPILPRLDGLGSGVQPVSAERSTLLPLAAPTLDQLLILRHAQAAQGPWVVGPSPQVLRVTTQPANTAGAAHQP